MSDLLKIFQNAIEKEEDNLETKSTIDTTKALDVATVKRFLRLDDSEDDDYLELIVIPASISYASTRTGIPEEELINYKDIRTALLLLCSINYDYRNGLTSSQLRENPIISTILNSHRRNLV